MIDITAWMNDFLQRLNHKFGNRVWFVGLQGSYGRGEAIVTRKQSPVHDFCHKRYLYCRNPTNVL